MKERSLEEMMWELISLYPGHHWELSMRRELDGGHGDPVFCIYAGLGDYDYESEEFIPVYINSKGDKCDENDPDAFELAYWSLDWTYYDLVKGIYDEVMKRRKE